MATVDKNFKVKHGLVVEGTTATVNGDNIVTEDAIQTITNKTTPNLTINDGTGNGGSVYAEGNNVTIAAANDLYLNTNNADINLQPDGAAKIWGKEIATKEYVDGQVPDNTDGLSEGTTNLYYTESRAKTDAAELLTGATLTNVTITGDGNGLTITAENGVADSTTDDLAEGSTNLYFTNERAQDAIGNSVGNGIEYDDATGAISVKVGLYNGNALGFDGSGNLKVNTDADDGTGNPTLSIQGSYNTLKVNTDVIASRAHVDTLIGDNTVDGTSGNTITDRIATAVANLVDGAPDLLNTLNELAAAIGDDENYATTVAGLVAAKQDTLIAGNGININPSTDEISVDDTVIASVDYVDTNFVNVADLPGQLDDYVPLTQKGANDGVATLDSNGNVPAAQLDNVYAAISQNPGTLNPTGIVIGGGGYYGQKGNGGSVIGQKKFGTAAIATTGSTSDTLGILYGTSNKVTVSARDSAGNIHTEELLVVIDDSSNIHITEYAIVTTSSSLFDVEITNVTSPWSNANKSAYFKIKRPDAATSGNKIVAVAGIESLWWDSSL